MLWGLLSLALLGTANSASFLPSGPAGFGDSCPGPVLATVRTKGGCQCELVVGESLLEDDSDEAGSLRLLQRHENVPAETARPRSAGSPRSRTPSPIQVFPPPLIYVFCTLLL
jgi:hypothetical protein